jgi:hypothetical protein
MRATGPRPERAGLVATSDRRYYPVVWTTDLEPKLHGADEPMNVIEKKAVIADFLAKCNQYADGQLAKYRTQLADTTGSEALAIQDKIGHWTAYRAFNEHALGELASGQLDGWLA